LVEPEAGKNLNEIMGGSAISAKNEPAVLATAATHSWAASAKRLGAISAKNEPAVLATAATHSWAASAKRLATGNV